MARRYAASAGAQLEFAFGPIRNSDLFSNHWLEARFSLEPEWREEEPNAREALDHLTALWKEEKNRLGKYENEQSLEYAFVQPVFEALGWKIIYQTFLRGRKPDYALFPDDASKNAALDAGKQSQAFWSLPALLADAKAWHVSLDRPTRVGGEREYPPEQIEWYLDKSRLDYGILTNGREWRLVPRELASDQRRFETYLAFDLPTFLDRWEREGKDFLHGQALFHDFLRFWLLFGPTAVAVKGGRRPLVERARKGSSEYRLGIGRDLRARVFEALRCCIEGFLRFGPNGLSPETDLATCREQSFILLYRLLFIMYAEDRGLLPYRKNRFYSENRSLARHRQEIGSRLDRLTHRSADDYSLESTALWDDLASLFDLIDAGKKAYDVPAYNGGLFDPEANAFLSSKRLSDWHLARVIDHLSRAEDEAHSGSPLYLVDYRDLQIQHLGNIYEGLLELHPRVAPERMEVVFSKGKAGRSEERTVPAAKAVPKGFQRTGIVYEAGSIYLETDKGERRASGSYYTPDHIVGYIVGKTLAPECHRISEKLRRDVENTEKMLAAASSEEARGKWEGRLAQLRSQYDDRILSLRVLDPAMGSGHFLLRACQFLAEEIATHPYASDPDCGATQTEEAAITFWKRRVVERCLYGVDINPLAVELAKLALWLETVATDQPLTFLDHHLRHGNSLVGADLPRLGARPMAGGAFEDAFGPQVAENLPALLKPLADIRQMPSETTAQVKEKEALYRKAFERARKPFVLVGDLWCSVYFMSEGAPDDAQYQSVIENLRKPASLKALTTEPWFSAAIERALRSDGRFFHWEFEFPEVFFDDAGLRVDAGFDAIIGNPPYDVLAEKETGRDLAGLRRFIDDQPAYRPSRRGKNNLYKLFICRSLQLLAEQGRLGFIVPMALLGDDQAADIRRSIIKQGAFTSIDAFPQKDDPHRRVFEEAKLSTAVFTAIRTRDKAARQKAFVSRVHPANAAEEGSPGLSLRTDDVPLYDASNLSIVTCSQEDWDLAIRMFSSGRMSRLKEFTEFFQGEANETIQRARGNLAASPNEGKLLIRGASICLYLPRLASQGEDLYLNVKRFLGDKTHDTKASHHQFRRVALQESCPQNNFRRIIAALVPAGEFFNHTINYTTQKHSRIALEIVLGLLNSKLADWFFRLGSTNAHVSHYQLYNLPCPVFRAAFNGEKPFTKQAIAALDKGDTESAFDVTLPSLERPPFGTEARDLIVECVNRIIAIEKERGEISRSERSALAPAAQPYQDLIDRLLYAMAGLSDDEARALESRLERML